jgi:hypothetical protein
VKYNTTITMVHVHGCGGLLHSRTPVVERGASRWSYMGAAGPGAIKASVYVNCSMGAADLKEVPISDLLDELLKENINILE